MNKKLIMKCCLLVLLFSRFFADGLSAQSVAINTDGSAANTSSILDIKSINKGVLMPRMTSLQRTAIGTPANGLMVFDITTNSPWYYNGTAWNNLSAVGATNYWSANGTGIYSNNAGYVGIGTSAPTSKLTIQTPDNTDGFTHISDGGILLKERVGGISASIGTFSPHTFRLVTNGLAALSIDINGNVGVGVIDQSFKMDIADRVRIRSGSVSSTAGISFNNANNSAVNAFIGTKDLDLVGIYGNGSGWGLLMNTTTGNVGIGPGRPVNKLQIGSLGATGYNGNDIAIGNGTNAMGIYQSNTSAAFVSSTDIVLMPQGNGHGRVGINTTTPRAPLDIRDVATVVNPNGGYSWFNGSTAILGGVEIGYASTNPLPNVSIMAEGRIYAAELDCYSDKRIKNIIGISNSTNDLQTINALQITDYTMKDMVKYGNKPYKKVIAQEVEKIYPQVISKHTDFIPNVYQSTNKIEKKANGHLLSFTSKHTISNTAKKLRVLLPGTEAMQEIDIVSIPSETEVIINVPDIKLDKAFVYGEEVDDFRTVDYEGLTTLNISATQELTKLIKKQQTIIETQQQQINQLLKRMEAVEKK